MQSQTEKDKYYLIYLKQKQPEFIHTKNRWVAARGGGQEVAKMGKGDQEVQTSSYEKRSLGM